MYRFRVDGLGFRPEGSGFSAVLIHSGFRVCTTVYRVQVRSFERLLGEP